VSEPQTYGPPPNARIDILTFDDGAKTLSVSLRGGDGSRSVDPPSITRLFGARIRHEQTTVLKDAARTLDIGTLAATTALGMPMVRQKKGPDNTVVSEHLQHALALRVEGVPEVWYLLAQSFNFRKALGPDAGYSTELNLRAFVKRLAEFAPGAAKDAYFEILTSGGKDLPAPVETLIDFLKTASK
jgi:hypothetical protein